MKKGLEYDKYIIIGQNSKLFNSISRDLNKSKIVNIRRSLYEYTEASKEFKSLKKTIESYKNLNIIIFVFAGVTNPNSKGHQEINYLLPLHLLNISVIYNFSIATFGTIMENHDFKNNYINSKKKFLEFSMKKKYKKHFHFQLHTVFGFKEAPKHMFLGQIIYSLKNDLLFKMSSGIQYREYQTYDDCSKRIIKYIFDEKTGINEISFNQKFKLVELAEYVFDSFSKKNLLHINHDDVVNNEIYNVLESECFNGKNKYKVFNDIVNFIKKTL